MNVIGIFEATQMFETKCVEGKVFPAQELSV